MIPANCPTSEAAARRYAPKAASETAKVLSLFEAAGERGMTDHELIRRYWLRHGQFDIPGIMQGMNARKRRIDLMHMGLVEDSGDRRNG